MNALQILKSEDGSALLIAVLILCILTILGVSSSNMATIDLQIAANDRDYVKEFYVSDSGWKAAANWLDIQASPPSKVNSSGNVVRNFGDGSTDTLNDTFPDGTEDATIDGMPYWYNVTYESDEVEPGSGKFYRKFVYTAKSVANKSQEIEVRLSKIYKVGY